MHAILIDADPLVALHHKHASHHQLCVDTLGNPVVSVWPAFTKAMYLLNFFGLHQVEWVNFRYIFDFPVHAPDQ